MMAELSEESLSPVLSEASLGSSSDEETPITKKSKRRTAENDDERESDTAEDFNQLSKREIIDKYKDLIDECEQFSTIEGINDVLMGDMNKNIEVGGNLYRSLLSKPTATKETYMAFLHCKAFTTVTRIKSETLGGTSSIFNFDRFIESVKNSFKGTDGEFEAREAQKELSKQLGEVAQLAPSIQLLLGTFEKAKENPVPPVVKEKETTVRAIPRQKRFDNVNATKHEVIVKSKEKRGKDSADLLSKSILEVLKRQHAKTKEPVNFLEFTFDKDSLARTVENMFCAGFLARDGFVSLAHKSPEQPNSILVLEPTEPHPNKEDPEQANRQQFIWSFTPQQWKKLAEEVSGDTVIVPSQRNVNKK